MTNLCTYIHTPALLSYLPKILSSHLRHTACTLYHLSIMDLSLESTSIKYLHFHIISAGSLFDCYGTCHHHPHRRLLTRRWCSPRSSDHMDYCSGLSRWDDGTTWRDQDDMTTETNRRTMYISTIPYASTKGTPIDGDWRLLTLDGWWLMMVCFDGNDKNSQNVTGVLQNENTFVCKHAK